MVPLTGVIISPLRHDEICETLLHGYGPWEDNDYYWLTPVTTPGYCTTPETQMIWFPLIKRAGIAHRGQVYYTDAASPHDAAVRWYGIEGSEMTG